jgi:hypothetical protein
VVGEVYREEPVGGGRLCKLHNQRFAGGIGEERPAYSHHSQCQDEISTEFRQSVNKVELPAFDGEDPAGWISRAEVNFRVQNTSPEVKTSLARLCMEGPTIHFFNSHQRGRESVVGPSEGSASGEVWRSLRG